MSAVHGPRRRRGVQYAALIVVLLLGTISFILIYAGPALCIGCPTTVQYNANGSTHTVKTVTLTGALSTQTLTGGPPSWPVGSAGYTFTISPSCFLGICPAPFGTWLVTLPSDASVGPTSSYVFVSTNSGTSFLNVANNAGLWSAEGPAMNNQNPFLINNTFTSSVSAPTPCNVASTTNVCKVNWYLNRYYFTVDMKTAGAALGISCYTSCQGYSSPLSNKAQYDAAFQNGFLGALSTMNSVSHLSSGTSLSLQLNVPPLPGGQSNLDFAGIVGAWTATPCQGGSATPSGGGIAQNDLCVTSCGAPAGCTIAQAAVHTPLTLWSDSGLTQRYLPNFSTYLGVQSYTANQLAAITPASIATTVYTKIDIADFGAGFSSQAGPFFANCGISDYRSCWTVAQPEAVLTIVYDILTSNHITQQYPTPPPATTTGAGGFDGQAVDGSVIWRPGIAGATVCLTDITGCVVADGGGYFTMSNVAPGTHMIQITAQGFFATVPINVNVGTGSTAHLGQIALNPTNPWYLGQACIIQPGTPSVFGLGGVCVPWIIVFSIIGLGFFAVGLLIYFRSPRFAGDAATEIARRLTPRNPLTPKGQRFVSARIAKEIRKNPRIDPKQAQAIAFNAARKRGFHVPPPPK